MTLLVILMRMCVCQHWLAVVVGGFSLKIKPDFELSHKKSAFVSKGAHALISEWVFKVKLRASF